MIQIYHWTLEDSILLCTVDVVLVQVSTTPEYVVVHTKGERYNVKPSSVKRFKKRSVLTFRNIWTVRNFGTAGTLEPQKHKKRIDARRRGETVCAVWTSRGEREARRRERSTEGGMAALCTALRQLQICLGMPPVVEAELSNTFVTESVPYRVSELFDKYDVDSDGKLTLEEWTAAITTEFPDLPEYARAEVQPYFAKYAKSSSQGGLVWTFLDKPHFSKCAFSIQPHWNPSTYILISAPSLSCLALACLLTHPEIDGSGLFPAGYAAFLFRNFDADNNGHLDLYEAEKALAYLTTGSGRPIKIALDPAWTEGDVKVGKPAFWAMYKQMLDS
jgi:hypothetical protein